MNRGSCHHSKPYWLYRPRNLLRRTSRGSCCNNRHLVDPCTPRACRKRTVSVHPPDYHIAACQHEASTKGLPIALTTRPRPNGIVTLKRRALSPVAQHYVDYARVLAKSFVN